MKLIDILKEIKIDRPASTGPIIKINDPEEYEAFKNREFGEMYTATVYWNGKSVGADFDIDDGQTSVLGIYHEDFENEDDYKDFITYLDKTKILPYEMGNDYIKLDSDIWPKFVKK